jgi:hypothetical protein
MSKKSGKKCLEYILIYVFVKAFHEKLIYLVSYVKKTKFGAKKRLSETFLYSVSFLYKT